MVTFREDKVAIRLCGRDAAKNVGVAGGGYPSAWLCLLEMSSGELSLYLVSLLDSMTMGSWQVPLLLQASLSFLIYKTQISSAC